MADVVVLGDTLLPVVVDNVIVSLAVVDTVITGLLVGEVKAVDIEDVSETVELETIEV